MIVYPLIFFHLTFSCNIYRTASDTELLYFICPLVKRFGSKKGSRLFLLAIIKCGAFKEIFISKLASFLNCCKIQLNNIIRSIAFQHINLSSIIQLNFNLVKMGAYSNGQKYKSPSSFSTILSTHIYLHFYFFMSSYHKIELKNHCFELCSLLLNCVCNS